MEAGIRHTVLSNLSIIVARALEQYGLNGREIVESAGIDYEFAMDPDTRISYEAADRMWQIATEKSADPCFGIEVAAGFNPSLLHGLGFSWMASGSLKEGFARVLRFQKLINTGANFHAIETDDHLKIIFDLNIPGRAHHPTYTLSLLAGVVRMSRLTAGQDIDPVAVSMRQKAPVCVERIRQFFRCPLTFESDENTVTFDRALIEKPILSANAKLAQINDQIVIDYLTRYDQQSLVAQVQAKIIERLPAGRPNQTAIARSMNMSLRNFQRKLKLEGTSFRELVDTIRKDLAIQFIRDYSRSIGAISYNLGFTEPANFTRSFKAWTGVSPKQFRQAISAGKEPTILS